MKKFLLSIFLSITLIVSTSYAEFKSDLIITSPNGIWTDSRAYTTLNDAIAAVGANERTIKIVSPQNVTDLTVPSTVTLFFERNGSITNSGQLTINTKNIFAPNRQIFTGVGNIDFAPGSTLKTGWFSNIETAFALTSNDEVTLIVSKSQSITANFSPGNDVHLKWEDPGNILTVNAGVVVGNLKNIKAGDYQIFAGSGDFDFLDGAELKLNWFNRLRSVLTWVEDEEVTIVVNEDSIVQVNATTAKNENIKVIPGGELIPDTGITLTINSFEAGRYQTFSGAGSVTFGSSYLDEVYAEWKGATFDGTTSDTVAIQWAWDTGKKVVFPYKKTTKVAQLILPSGLRLDGNYTTLSRDVVALPGVPTGFDPTGSLGWFSIITSGAISDVTIERLKFDEHNSDSNTLFRGSIGLYHNVTDMLVDDCEWVDTYSGVYVTGSVAATRVKIINNRIVGTFVATGGSWPTHTNPYHIFQSGYNATDCLVKDCYAENTWELCIFNADLTGGLSNNTRCSVIDNTAINCYGSIYLYGTYHIIEGNKVYGSGKDGIKLNSVTNTPAQYCIVANNYSEGCGRLDATGTSTYYISGDHHNITGNIAVLLDPTTFPTPVQDGIRISASETIVSGNTLIGPSDLTLPSVGIRGAAAFWGGLTNFPSNNTIIANTFQSCKAGIMANEEAQNWNVSGNTFYVKSAVFWNNQTDNHVEPVNLAIIGNVFHGLTGGSDTYLISLRYIDRVCLTGNIFSGDRTYDLYPVAWTGAIIGNGNISDNFASTLSCIERGQIYAGNPSLGTWHVGEIISSTTAKRRCTVAGTAGILNGGATTGGITINTPTLTVNSATGLYVGVYISIAGVTGTKRVIAVSGTTITLDSNADATVAGAAVAYVNVTWVTTSPWI